MLDGRVCFCVANLCRLLRFQLPSAQGVAKWMGVDLMTNFRMPYLAANPSEFWRRWHISLSKWLRDYLFIPLGGSRANKWLTYSNLLITMTLGGIWHGANWTFIVRGALNGLLLCGHHWEAVNRARSVAPARGLSLLWRRFATFHLIAAGWLFFWAESVTLVDMRTAAALPLDAFTYRYQLSDKGAKLYSTALASTLKSRRLFEKPSLGTAAGNHNHGPANTGN